MKRGAILEAAHRDTKAVGLAGCVILVAVCVGVLAFNWKYVYNVAAGPVPFTMALSADRYPNLFVLGAAVLLPISIGLTIFAFRSRIDIERYPPIAGLKRFGHPSFVIDSIEKELTTAGASAYVAPLWIGPSWLVRLEPGLQIFKISTIVAGAYVTTPGKGSNPSTHAVRFWVAGETVPATVDMSEKEAQAVLATLKSRAPGIVHDDAEAFDKRWKQDQDGCERDAKAREAKTHEAKTRRRLPRSA